MRGIAKSNDGASATRLAYSPDGKFIATGASDRRRDLRMPTEEERIGDEYSDITVWNMETGKAIWETRAHSGRVTGLAFSPDCQILASAGKYGVRVWDVRTWRELEHFDNKDMFGVAFSSRGHLAWTTSNETVVWDPMERRIVLSVNRGGFDVAFNPAGTRVAFGNGNTVVLVDSESGEEFWKARARTRPYRLAFSPDGQKLAVGVGREGNMVADVFDANNGQELVRITSDFRSDLTLDLEFSPDSRLLATANIGAVRIWNATTGHQILRFSQNAGTVDTDRERAYAVAFSPDGRRLVAGWSAARINGRGERELIPGGNVIVWDTATGQDELAYKWCAPQRVFGIRQAFPCICQAIR